MKATLPVVVMEKLLKKAGAERVSVKAKEELLKLIKEKNKEISKKAVEYAKHAGRKTVKREDIELSIETSS